MNLYIPFTSIKISLLHLGISVMSLLGRTASANADNASKEVCVIPSNPLAGINTETHRLSPAFLKQLEREYVIFGNAPLAEAEHIFFAERHVLAHKTLHARYTSRLSIDKKLEQGGDPILIEGREQLKLTSCNDPVSDHQEVWLSRQQRCLGLDIPKFKKNIENEFGKLADKYSVVFGKIFSKNPEVILNKIRSLRKENIQEPSFFLLGLDEIKQVDTFIRERKRTPVELQRVMKGILGYKIADALSKFGSNEFYRNKYAEIFGKKEINTFYQALIKILSPAPNDQILIREKNEEFMQTIQLMSCGSHTHECPRKLYVMGARHLFDAPKTATNYDDPKKGPIVKVGGISDPKKKRALIFSRMAKWESGSVEAPLREFLEEKRYALLYPANG